MEEIVQDLRRNSIPKTVQDDPSISTLTQLTKFSRLFQTSNAIRTTIRHDDVVS